MNPRRTLLLLILLLLGMPAILAQPWIRSYTNHWGTEGRVERLANGDALVHAERGHRLARITPLGNVVWDRSYGMAIHRVVEQASGALVAMGVVPHATLPETGQPAILRLDAQGQPTGPFTVIGVDVQGHDWFDMAMVPGGGIVISTHNGSGAGSVHAFDVNGAHLWSRNGNGRTPSRIACASDGSIYGVYGPLIMKWSATGDFIWRKSLSLAGGSLVLWEILITADIPVVLARRGASGQPSGPALLMFTADGQLSNAVTWDLAQFEHGMSYTGFSATPGGAIAIAASFTSNIPYVQRGALITTYIDPTIANTRCEEVDLGIATLNDVAASDGSGCYITGYSPSNGTQGGSLLMRTNSSWQMGDCSTNLGSLINNLITPVVATSTGQLPLALSPVMTTRPVTATTETTEVFPVCGAGDRSAVRLRMMLGGPYDSVTGLMSDGLRANALVPLAQPYTALGYTQVGAIGGTTTEARLAVGGPQAVVDWVFVELLAPDGNVVSTRTALLRRNGTVTMPHGSATIVFHVPAGNYHVRVRHRNHLAAITAAPIALGTNPLLDLTTAPTYGTEAQQNLGGVAMLWAGDVNGDGEVRYVGQNNDRDPILVAIGGSTPTNTVSAWYTGTDVNMDGVVKYVGDYNDRDIILQVIGGSVPTAVRAAQGF